MRIIFGGENSFSEIMVRYSHPQVRIGTPKHLGVRIANNNLKKAILTPKNAVLKKPGVRIAPPLNGTKCFVE